MGKWCKTPNPLAPSSSGSRAPLGRKKTTNRPNPRGGCGARVLRVRAAHLWPPEAVTPRVTCARVGGGADSAGAARSARSQMRQTVPISIVTDVLPRGQFPRETRIEWWGSKSRERQAEITQISGSISENHESQKKKSRILYNGP